MNSKSIAIAKKATLIFWLSILIVALFFLDSNFGQKYVMFGVFIFLIHVIETFIFDKLLKKHSKNIVLDKLLMLPMGATIPLGLIAESKAKDKIQESEQG